MILYLASIVIWLFICANLFYRADCATIWKLVGCGALLVISCKYEIYAVFGGAFFAPQLPRWLLLGFEALYGAFLILFFLLLLWDVYLAGNWILAKTGLPVPQHLPRGIITGGLATLALALGIWGTYQAVQVPEVRRITVEIGHLPPALEGLRLVQLSDLHIGPMLKGDWLGEVVRRTNALQADIVLLTGDYVDGTVEEIGSELAPLGQLKGKYGVFAVNGNHEYYWNMPQWRQFLRGMDIDVLENEHRALNIHGATVVVAGLTDLAAGRFGMEEPDAAAALAEAPEGVRILLSHQPKSPGYEESTADVILSGHTHGGLMFFLQPLIARFNKGYVAGMYHRGDTQVYVSSGTALWNGLSCRLGVPPEITLFTLERGMEGADSPG